jgi:hypothetical protein
MQIKIHQQTRVVTKGFAPSSGYMSRNFSRKDFTTSCGIRNPSCPWLMTVCGVDIGLEGPEMYRLYPAAWRAILMVFSSLGWESISKLAWECNGHVLGTYRSLKQSRA